MNRVFDIKGHILYTKEWFNILLNNLNLLFMLSKKEVTETFSGQIFGSLWAIGHPLFLIFFYTLIFSVLFPTKFGENLNLPLDFTSYLLAGLVPWLSIQQAITKSCSSISANASLVKQLIFPLEILPLTPILNALLPLSIGLSFLILYNLVVHKAFYLTYLLLPLVLTMQCFLMIGISYALSSLSVYLKDTKDFLQLYTTVSMFLTPIVFMPASAPIFLKPLFYTNPFSYLIWVYQDVFYYGAITKYYAWLFIFIFYPIVFILGYRTFRKLKSYFVHAL